VAVAEIAITVVGEIIVVAVATAILVKIQLNPDTFLLKCST